MILVRLCSCLPVKLLVHLAFEMSNGGGGGGGQGREGGMVFEMSNGGRAGEVGWSEIAMETLNRVLCYAVIYHSFICKRKLKATEIK